MLLHCFPTYAIKSYSFVLSLRPFISVVCTLKNGNSCNSYHFLILSYCCCFLQFFFCLSFATWFFFSFVFFKQRSILHYLIHTLLLSTMLRMLYDSFVQRSSGKLSQYWPHCVSFGKLIGTRPHENQTKIWCSCFNPINNEMVIRYADTWPILNSKQLIIGDIIGSSLGIITLSMRQQFVLGFLQFN